MSDWGETVKVGTQWLGARVAERIGVAVEVEGTGHCRIPKVLDELALAIVQRGGTSTLSSSVAELFAIARQGPEACRAELAALTLAEVDRG